MFRARRSQEEVLGPLARALPAILGSSERTSKRRPVGIAGYMRGPGRISFGPELELRRLAPWLSSAEPRGYWGVWSFPVLTLAWLNEDVSRIRVSRLSRPSVGPGRLIRQLSLTRRRLL